MNLRSPGPLVFFLRMAVVAVALVGCYALLQPLMPGQTLRLAIVLGAVFVMLWNEFVPEGGILPQWEDREIPVSAEAAKAAEPPLGEGAEAGEKPAADAAEPRKGRWQARAARARRQAEFDANAFSVRAHNWAFRKAMHGDPEWFVRLGEYAWRRGAMVESHYWITVAKAHGVAGLDDRLKYLRKRWVQAGHRLGDGRIYETFPRERMELANHYMMFACRFSAEVNRLWIEREAQSGNVDALKILDILDK